MMLRVGFLLLVLGLCAANPTPGTDNVEETTVPTEATTTPTPTPPPEGDRIDRKCNSNIFKRWGYRYASRRGGSEGPAEHGVSPQCTRGHLTWNYPSKKLLIEWNRSVPYMRYVCVRFGFVPAIVSWRQIIGVRQSYLLDQPDTREMYCFKTVNRTVDLLLTSTDRVTYYMTYIQFQSPIEVPITKEIIHFMDFQDKLREADLKLEPYLEYDDEGRVIPQDPKDCTCEPIQKEEDCQCDHMANSFGSFNEAAAPTEEPSTGPEEEATTELLTRAELCRKHPYWTDGVKVRSCRYVFDESWMERRWNIG